MTASHGKNGGGERVLAEHIVDFVHGPYAMLLGTRDAKMAPLGTFVGGARADAGNDQVTLYIADVYAEPALANLRDNGQAALTMGHGARHETMQLKGTFVEARPTTEEERAIQDIYKTKCQNVWRQELGDVGAAMFERMVFTPSTAVTMRVTEVFDQTPGPNAGKKLAVE